MFPKAFRRRRSGRLLPVGSKNSCGLSVIKFQEAAEALASLYIPCYFADPILGRWKQDDVALALVISLRVEMIHVVFKAVAERAFSEKNHFRQELGLYESNPAFAMDAPSVKRRREIGLKKTSLTVVAA
ncbi:MAG: hypothetical protein EXS36_01025 [Pedosphaera sp.]|nr:hypothetical protein [Pedosphaera sp.]